MSSTKTGVPLTVPSDVWEPLTEIRAQLDSFCPGEPTPIHEVLREVLSHYKHCAKAQDEMDSFCERAKAWKKSS
jgi:hypothetical protein